MSQCPFIPAFFAGARAFSDWEDVEGLQDSAASRQVAMPLRAFSDWEAVRPFIPAGHRQLVAMPLRAFSDWEENFAAIPVLPPGLVAMPLRAFSDWEALRQPDAPLREQVSRNALAGIF